MSNKINWKRYEVRRKLKVTDVTEASFQELLVKYPSLASRVEKEKERLKKEREEEAKKWLKQVLKRKVTHTSSNSSK